MPTVSQPDPTSFATHADDVRYFVKTYQPEHTRSNPCGFLRTYRTGQVTHDEVYSFSKLGWEDTEFFQLYKLGHQDFGYEEVPAEEAKKLLQEKLQRKAERELADNATASDGRGGVTTH